MALSCQNQANFNGVIMKEILTLASALLCGAIPFTYLAAKAVAQTDLRQVGSGTVSGTALFQVAGFWPLAVAGILDVAKAAPALLVADDAALLAALAFGLTVAGHNWSPFLGWHGGRGLSPAVGGLLVIAWPGAVCLLAALALGRLLRQTGLVAFVALLGLPWLLLLTHGNHACLAGGLALAAILLKRVAGNAPPPPGQPRLRTLAHRLVFDNDGTAPEATGLR